MRRHLVTLTLTLTLTLPLPLTLTLILTATLRRPQGSKKPRGARLPEENLTNPYLTANIEPAPVDRWGLSKTFQGHTASVSAVAAYHP